MTTAERPFVASRQEMEDILRQELVGYLGLADAGRPYVLPVNYAYADGAIVLHCALKGRKLDCIRAQPEVCFTVARAMAAVSSHPPGDPCHLDSESVLCRGRARLVEEHAEKARLLNAFNRRYRPDAPDIADNRVRGCAVVEIRLAEMTGRREVARTRTYYRWQF